MNISKKLFIVITMALGMTFSYANAANMSNDTEKVEATNGGSITYVGYLGQYKVEFSYTNLHMSPDEPFFSYRYLTTKTNNGRSIDLKYSGERDGFAIWKEYIRGKNTGTFYIKRTNTKITGTFVNSKGQKFNVSASMTESNWADEF